MSVNFPASLDTLTNPTATDYLNSPSHAGQHATANDILEALEAKVGINSSAVTTSHDYKLSEVTGTDKAVGKSATQILTNKYIDIKAPRGFLINGKITVTDSGSGLVVAVKGLDGNDPSATNPVYCRIGDTVRTITSALSRTLADGTNWFNAGSTELCTKEIDYFTYLVYDSNSSSVGLGFARVPYGNLVSDFSATTTAETHLAGYADFTTTDEVEVIGRFAATLSAPAGYTWSVPTFTASNLIQRPIFETRWLYWLPTWVGFSVNPTNVLHKYKINSRTVHLVIRESTPGTSNATNFTESAPLTPITETNQVFVSFGTGQDNSINCGATISISSGIPTINIGFGTNNVTAGWTASGGKRITGQLMYEI